MPLSLSPRSATLPEGDPTEPCYSDLRCGAWECVKTTGGSGGSAAVVTASTGPGRTQNPLKLIHIATASGREFDINGEVKGFIPLRNRRGGMTTHIGEGMTEWTMNGRTGYGLSEFLRQV